MSAALAVVLAAGQGTRMKSRTPKVLHRVAGKAMVDHVLAAARAAGADRCIVIVGHEIERLREHFAGSDVELVEQRPQLGTGHAVQQVLPQLEAHRGEVLVLNGDAPLVDARSLGELLERHHAARAQVTFLTALVDDAERLGRITSDGGRVRVVEWADATAEERAIREVNTGIYCFDSAWLSRELPLLQASPAKGEYYLTDLIERAPQVERMLAEGGFALCIGVDTREKLAQAEREMQRRLRERWMAEGVTFLSPETVLLDVDCSLGQDTIVYPNTIMQRCTIGMGCIIGPGSRLEDTRIGNDCSIRESVVESAVVEDEVQIGPFCHLRPGSYIERGAKLGNYAEIKSSRIGRETQIHHFSYTGDAQVGQRVNIGAGTITCNYSSETGVKSATIIGDDASTGSDTLLVAPVTLGAGAMTGSGAVVTHDVPPDTLVVGVPAREVRKVRKAARS